MDEQRKLILDQFTRQAVPFAKLHADDEDIHELLIRTADITSEDEVLTSPAVQDWLLARSLRSLGTSRGSI